MRLILNGINGRYLREILVNAAPDTDVVEAAVAYASYDALFEWCIENDIPLRFWGRFDDGVPVALPLLKGFLARRSANYTCKLLTHFHAKVIWWHGYGAYVGSANLTDRAWHNNIEAGCFFDEGEITGTSLDDELQAFFRRVDEESSPITEELVNSLEQRARELQRLREQDGDRGKTLLRNPGIKQWGGLVNVNRPNAMSRRKEAFMEEWFNTLQTLRMIGARISEDGGRPPWIPSDVPHGAQADQFLHAHYYTHVIGADDRKSYFAEQYELNKNNPERAFTETAIWWRSLPSAPKGESRMLFEWAPFLRERLSEENVRNMSREDFSAICQRVWSIQDHGRRVANRVLNLTEGSLHPMEEKTPALANYLFNQRAPNGATIPEVIHFVLYGGAEGDLVSRLWDATTDGPWKIDHLGVSALGEIVGWALPDRFPPRNNRTSKALRSLGFPVRVHG